MKPSLTRNNSYFPYLLLLIQPVFMASNIIVARGGVEYVPPISLAFWRWLTVFFILSPFFLNEVFKKKKDLNKEFWKLFFLGSMGCGVCGAFPFIAGMSTTMANMGIIYTSSPIFIIILSVMFFKDKITSSRIIGLLICMIGVLTIIGKGNLQLLLNLKFTSGDLWMIGAAIGWAVYSIYLLNWKSNFSLMGRFTIISLFGAISLFPFYLIEEIYFLILSLIIILFFGFFLPQFHLVLLLLHYIPRFKNMLEHLWRVLRFIYSPFTQLFTE